MTDDKFSLGGRWLRGFDNFGAGEIVNKSCARKVKIDSLDNSINNMAREIKDIFNKEAIIGQ